MSAPTQAICITVIMAAALALPSAFPRIRQHASTLLLIGTGALLGLVAFDLLPDMMEFGGILSAVIALVAWALYAATHMMHVGHHDWGHHEPGWEPEIHTARATGFLVAALVGHSFSSGMFLTLSHDMTARIASSVFLAMVAHKGYESLAIALVLEHSPVRKGRLGIYRAFYLLSFPAGAALASGGLRLAGGHVTPATVKTVAIVISSIALGSFLGCLFHDFVLPSVKSIRQKRSSAGWLALGGICTGLVMRGLGG